MEQQNSQDKLNSQKNLGFEQCPFYRDQSEESVDDFTDLRRSHHHGCCGSNWFGAPSSFYPYQYNMNSCNCYPYSPFFRDEEEDINSESDFIDQDGYRHHHHHHHDCCCGNSWGGWNGFGYPNATQYGNKNVNANVNFNRDEEEDINFEDDYIDQDGYRHHHHHDCCCGNGWGGWNGSGYPNVIPYGNGPSCGEKNVNQNVNVNIDDDDMNFHGYRHSHHHDCEPEICLPKIPVPKMKWIKPKFYTPKCGAYQYYPNMPYGNMPYPNMGFYGNKNVNDNININK